MMTDFSLSSSYTQQHQVIYEHIVKLFFQLPSQGWINRNINPIQGNWFVIFIYINSVGEMILFQGRYFSSTNIRLLLLLITHFTQYEQKTRDAIIIGSVAKTSLPLYFDPKREKKKYPVIVMCDWWVCGTFRTALCRLRRRRHPLPDRPVLHIQLNQSVSGPLEGAKRFIPGIGKNLY